MPELHSRTGGPTPVVGIHQARAAGVAGGAADFHVDAAGLVK